MIQSGIVTIYGGKEYDQPEAMVTNMIKVMEEAPDRAARQISADMLKYLQRVATLLAKKHGTRWKAGSEGGEYLHVRSGDGIKSIMTSIKVYGNNLSALTGNIDTGTMGIHEKGGYIAASGSGYLTIPLPAALDARGVPIYPDARSWPNTFTQRSRKGNLIIFQNQGRRTPIPLYVLKKQVYIPPRLHMEDTLLGELPFFVERLIDDLAEEFAK